jgi:AcrR family transcriptional regulator
LETKETLTVSNGSAMKQAHTGSLPTLLGDADPNPTKERIMQYAVIRFFDAGFQNVSINQLTSELGMSKKTFYRVFESKDDLVRQLVLRMVANIARRAQAIIDAERPFVQKIEALMDHLAEQIRRLNRPLMQELLRYQPALWDEVQSFRRKRVMEVFSALIAEGKASGRIRPELNTRIFLLTFIGAVEAVLTPTVLADEAFSGDEVVVGMLSTFFHGILTEKAGNELRSFHTTST